MAEVREGELPVSSHPAGRGLPGAPGEGVCPPLTSPELSGVPNPLGTALGMVTPVLFIPRVKPGAAWVQAAEPGAPGAASTQPQGLQVAMRTPAPPAHGLPQKAACPGPPLCCPHPASLPSQPRHPSLQTGPSRGVWPGRVVRWGSRAGRGLWALAAQDAAARPGPEPGVQGARPAGPGQGLGGGNRCPGRTEMWTGPSDHGGPAAPHGGLGHEAGIGRAGPRLPTALALSSAPWPQGAPGPLTRHGERLSTQEPPEGSGEQQPSQRTVLGALGRAEATAGQDSSRRLGHRGPPYGATPFLLPLLPPLGVGGQTPHVANWRHNSVRPHGKGARSRRLPG